MKAKSKLAGNGSRERPPADREWWTTTQVGKRLGVSNAAVAKWCNSGRMACVTMPDSTHRRIHIHAIEDFERANGYDRARRYE
jgi:hypothetical protein